jgi:hypothetical protein
VQCFVIMCKKKSEENYFQFEREKIHLGSHQLRNFNPVWFFFKLGLRPLSNKNLYKLEVVLTWILSYWYLVLSCFFFAPLICHLACYFAFNLVLDGPEAV